MAFIHVSSDMTMGDLVVGAGTLALASFTAWLASRTSKEVKVSEEQVRLSRESIEAQEKMRRRARQEDAAVALDRVMMNMDQKVPTGVVTRQAAWLPIEEAHQTVREEWGLARAFLHREASIDLGVRVLDNLLLIAAMDCGTDQKTEQNFAPLGSAFEDVRDALSAFVNGEDPPQPRLPNPKRLIQLANPKGKNLGLEGVRRHLVGEAP